MGQVEYPPAWDFKRAKSKPAVVLQAKKDWRSVHFAPSMDLCHLKLSELVIQLQTYRWRVVIRRDNVKDDSGYSAIFMEQVAAALKLPAAQFLVIISRQANDAVPAYAHLHLSETSRLLRLLEKERPLVWIRPPHSRRPKQLDLIEEPVVLRANFVQSPLAGLLRERELAQVLLKHGWESPTRQHQDGWKDKEIWDLCGNSATRYRSGRNDPFAKSSILGMHPERSRI